MQSCEPLINLDAAQRELTSMAAGRNWLLSEIERQGGEFAFPPWIAQLIADLHLGSYPLLYRSDSALAEFMLRSLMSPDEIFDFNRRVTLASLEERGQFMAELDGRYGHIDLSSKIPRTQADSERIRKERASLEPAECERQIKRHQTLWMALLVSLFNDLSVVVHGVKLTRLVGWAMAGDDAAFVKAIQIDKRILLTIPSSVPTFFRGD